MNTMDTIEANVDSTALASIVGQVVDFPPEQLKTDQELSVRNATISKKDREKTERLAETILEVGQLQDAGAYPVLRENGDIEYHLFMGNRRREAIRHLNTLGKGEFTLRVRIFAPQEARELKRKALIENVHRENYSAVALARQIKTIREENGWSDKKNWSALVADYLKVSRAQVTQHLRLLDELEPEQLKRIEAEGWSAIAAFELLDTVPEKRGEVAEAATKAAKEEHQEKSKKAKEGKPEPVKADGKAHPESEAEPVVKAKHVRKAAREAEANTTQKPLAKSEIIDFFRQIADAPSAYGYINSPARQFATYFTTKFCAGTGKEKTLRDKFDAMIMDDDGVLFSGVGTPNKAEIQDQADEDARAAEAEAKKKKSKASR